MGKIVFFVAIKFHNWRIQFILILLRLFIMYVDINFHSCSIIDIIDFLFFFTEFDEGRIFFPRWIKLSFEKGMVKLKNLNNRFVEVKCNKSHKLIPLISIIR